MWCVGQREALGAAPSLLFEPGQVERRRDENGTIVTFTTLLVGQNSTSCPLAGL